MFDYVSHLPSAASFIDMDQSVLHFLLNSYKNVWLKNYLSVCSSQPTSKAEVSSTLSAETINPK